MDFDSTMQTPLIKIIPPVYGVMIKYGNQLVNAPCTSLYVFTVCIQISLVLVFAFVDWTTNQNCVFILVGTIIVRFSTIYKFFRCVSKKFIVANQESTLSFINKRQSFR